jgi:hypothetical protein
MRACPFGGEVQNGQTYSKFGQQYLVASSESPSLQSGKKDCLGDSANDPVGASFDEVYDGHFNYVVWNATKKRNEDFLKQLDKDRIEWCFPSLVLASIERSVAGATLSGVTRGSLHKTGAAEIRLSRYLRHGRPSHTAQG